MHDILLVQIIQAQKAASSNIANHRFYQFPFFAKIAAE